MKEKVVADVMEALIGTVLMEGQGLQPVDRFLHSTGVLTHLEFPRPSSGPPTHRMPAAGMARSDSNLCQSSSIIQ